jgi:1-acyl-sn-glycerol-3-phosphate acyltransferase
VAGGKVEVEGLGHVAGVRGPVVFVGNHMSTLETLLLPGFMLPFKDVAFVVKDSLLSYPVFGPIMRAVKHIPVARVNPREDLKAVLTQGEAMLRAGVSVVIFPQATRSVEFSVEEFNTLGVKLAGRAGAPMGGCSRISGWWMTARRSILRLALRWVWRGTGGMPMRPWWRLLPPISSNGAGG